ncbi:MAG: hypothetical protein H0U59_10660 [Gemmatimonadaceae bacterium]|nr:hypothetical protein [Gemmatimonadaceae bacterium]
MQHITAAMQGEPNPDETETTRHVRELAQAWEAGTLPLPELRRQCSGYERSVAVRYAGNGSADKRLVMRLLDALVAAQGVQETKQGVFTREDLFGAVQTRDKNGHRVIQFRDVDDAGRGYYREIPEWKLAEGARLNDR